ncbi:MAG: gluconokinase [Elainellaceae cyanobacterium]
MASYQYVVGIDIGTTSTKSVLFTTAGTIVGKASQGYPLYTPDRSTAEQDPKQIFAAVIDTVRRVVRTCQIQPRNILCLSVSAAMHSLLLVDAEGAPLTRSMTWADNRSAAWATRIKRDYDSHAIYRRTGTPIHPMSPLVKLMGLRHEQPDLFSRAAKFISIKEYVFYRLFRQYVIDHSMAAATGLLNINQLDWDAEALELAGVSKKLLSELVPTTQVLQSMQPDMAAAMGILPETPVVIGASDGVLSNLGVGAIAPHVVAITIGTSGAVRAVIDRPITDPPPTDPQERLFCYPLTEHYWVIGGAVNNGGLALRWVRDQLADAEIATAERLGKNVYELLTMLAETVPPGSDGLIFHPYLVGERSPLWNADARASFFGLSLNHTKSHLVRAVLEGIIYNLYLVFKALEDFAGDTTRIQATGGFAESTLWRQMMADIFNREVVIPEQYESSCLGAAILGLYALGEISSLDVATTMVGETHHHSPNDSNVAIYQTILPVFERLVNVFAGEYEAIAHFQTKLATMAED